MFPTVRARERGRFLFFFTISALLSLGQTIGISCSEALYLARVGPSGLPWAITFRSGTLPFKVLVDRGFVDLDATATMLMHPTQIYSSMNGFILAFVTATYFYRRSHVGDVFALSLILYPINPIFTTDRF